MKEIKQDFWEVYDRFDAIVCPTNGIVKTNGELVMGGGLAKQFKENFPYIPFVWGNFVNETGNKVCKYSHRKSSNLPDLISFPSKHHWKSKSDLKLITSSTYELVECVDYQGYDNVLVPRVGCGLGGLKWEIVKPILEIYLDKRFTIISK
jgi:O-acetyl-ADP-ribose deacetylase (regulator of RNase III)